MNDRIKLAEAMGWRHNESSWAGNKQWFAPNNPRPRWKNPPDPFTDANDDYAVLRWLRDPDIENISDEKWSSFVMDMPEAHEYQVGDFARAALKVLE